MTDDDDADEPRRYSAPLPPEDRLWRHPSELGAAPVPEGAPAPGGPPAGAASERSLWGIAAASAAIGAVAAAAVLLGVGLSAERDQPVEERRVPAAQSFDAAQLAQDALPAVVRIDVTRGDAGVATGSGVVFRDDGHVITTADLLAGAEEVTAVLHDGRTVTGRIVGADATNDIGVVALDLEGAPSAALGSAEALQPGEAAIVLSPAPSPGAAPFVARVVVTGLGGTATLGDGSELYGMVTLTGAIGALAPGSVLLDQSGGVVGITTGRHPDDAVSAGEVSEPTVELTVAHDRSLPSQGTAWLTPVDFARDVATDIIETGQARHAWLGLTDEPAADPTRSARDVDGAVVVAVDEGSPADLVGLRPDDVVVAIAGRRVSSMAELVVALRSLDPGDSVELEYRRDGESRRCRPVLAESAA